VSVSDDDLIALAMAARQRAYAPYSHFLVGAAVLAVSGATYTGANVENASYGLSVCAERVAIWQAAVAGERQLVAIAVVTENGVTPCGACRQVLAEFATGPDALQGVRVIVAEPSGRHSVYTLADLLPQAFVPGHLPSATRGGQ